MSTEKAPMPALPPARDETCRELRCLCRSLLAREQDGYLELKCRRCKRTLRLRLDRDWQVIPGH